jgi:hypothetical protein
VAVVAAAFGLLACGQKAEPAASGATATAEVAASAGASASAAAAAPVARLEVPASDKWPRVVFAPMKIAYRRPPSLIEEPGTMTQEAKARFGPEAWSMSTRTKGGVELHVTELGAKAGQDRKAWFAELLAAAVPGEVLFDDADAIVKRARLLGTKAKDGSPRLADSHFEVAACKRLGESDYCAAVTGSVDLAMSKPPLTELEAMELVALVRSLERTK